jgi:hypothetical protein
MEVGSCSLHWACDDAQEREAVPSQESVARERRWSALAEDGRQ